VIGLGRAGSARVRAIAAQPQAELGAAVARPPAEPRFEAVLADPGISALIVCTPNALHPAQVEAALRADKHVAVEFPLAESELRAVALFELARARRRVLHVEHIELLSPSQAQMRAAVRRLGPPAGGRLHFRGDSRGWIGDPALAGSPGLRALARLHRLVDLFGEAQLESARVAHGAQGAYRLDVRLRFGAAPLDLIEERAPGLARALEWDLRCREGAVPPPSPETPAGLFARDLELFLARIGTGAPACVSEARELHVHALVDAIDRTPVCSRG
jgi:predicted dehydrogenase